MDEVNHGPCTRMRKLQSLMIVVKLVVCKRSAEDFVWGVHSRHSLCLSVSVRGTRSRCTTLVVYVYDSVSRPILYRHPLVVDTFLPPLYFWDVSSWTLTHTTSGLLRRRSVRLRPCFWQESPMLWSGFTGPKMSGRNEWFGLYPVGSFLYCSGQSRKSVWDFPDCWPSTDVSTCSSGRNFPLDPLC